MRLKTRTWIVLSIVLIVTTALYWRLTLTRRVSSTAADATTSTVPKPIALVITNALATPSAAPPSGVFSNATYAVIATNPPNALFTNQLAYRLTNTAQPFEQLIRNENAVLLRNALIDTTLGPPRIPAHLRAQGDPGSYIVQARGAITDGFRAQIAAAGGEIVSYVPNNAYLVRATATEAQTLRTSPLTQAVLPFEPYYKLDSSLLRIAVRQELSPYPLLNVVGFPRQTERVRAALENLGAVVVGEPESAVFGDVLKVKVPADRVAEVAQIPEVQMLGVNFQKRAANDLTRVITRVSTNVPIVKPPQSHYAAPGPTDYLTGQGILVAIADTGVDDLHPALTGRIEPGSYLGPVGKDPDGHGTHVTGTFIGDGAESGPLQSGAAALGSLTNAVFAGMAPSARAFVQDLYLPDSILQREAALQGALINNNSWGFPGNNDYDIFAASYDAAVRDSLPGVTGEQQVAYVFAAGNDGAGSADGLSGFPSSIISPATAKNVITVGGSDLPRFITNRVIRACRDVNVVVDGVTNTVTVCETNYPWIAMTDTNNQVSGYSARGNVGIGIEGFSGRFKPDVVAPGSMVVSARSSSFLEPDGSTNTSVFQFNNVVVGFNRTNLYALAIPPNAIRFQIFVATNGLSPTNLSLLIGAGYSAAAANPTTTIDPNNPFLLQRPLLVPGLLYYAFGNTNHSPNANFDLVLLMTVTNDVGDYYTVLQKLNEPLGPHYRYEAGTSMAAPAVSGILALIQEYLTNNFNLRPSPALLKAMVINGARSLNDNYNLQINAPVNHQGWGLVNMSNTIPSGLSPQTTNGPLRFFDQTNWLATGGTEVYEITVPDEAKSFPLRVTMVWSDPPGNPVTGIKLVNDMNLSVFGEATNSSTLNTNSLVWLGNNFPPASDFTDPLNVASNGIPSPAVTQQIEATRDIVNNVENVYIRPPLASRYTVVVKAHRVNVNAVNSHLSSHVQDYALVISSGNVTRSNAVNLTVTGPAFTNDPTARIGALVRDTNATSAALLNQRVGANNPLINSTNGASNQWCFFTYTNVPTANFTNVAILTFLPPNLSLARYREADIDLYVAHGANASNLFLLDENIISSSTRSVRRGGTEVLLFKDAKPDEVFYIGVKSEDQQAANFAIYAASSDVPFSSRDASNNIIVSARSLPQDIPDGSPEKPGGTNVLMIVDPLDWDTSIQRIYVTNGIYHEEAGDLIGILNRLTGTNAVALNNHRTWSGYDLTVYDEQGDLGDETDIPPVLLPDGPGRLRDFIGEQAGPVWNFAISDNGPNQTGYVDIVTLVIEPSSTNNSDPNVIIDRRFCVSPGQWVYAAGNVPFDAFNMETCISDFETASPIEVFIKQGDFPDFGNFDHLFHAAPPGRCFDIGLGDNPPLSPGRWFFGFYNSNSVPVCFHARVTLARRSIAGPYAKYFSADTPKRIIDDAKTNSLIFVPDRGRISDLRVGIRVDHERASDLVFHLTSPSGTRLLLAENRGGPFGTNYGAGILQSNVFITNPNPNGDFRPDTNTVSGGSTEGTVKIDYEFFDVPDRMTIYYEGRLIYDTGLISGAGTFYVDYGPGISNEVVIIMNEDGNPDTSTAWNYTATLLTRYIYTTFTENTNLTTLPIKFGTAPFTNSGGFVQLGTNVLLYSNNFERVIGSEWSPAVTNIIPTLQTGYLGDFGNRAPGGYGPSFNFVSNQPPHSQIEVSFDLYIINSWDGNPGSTVGAPGPDFWNWTFAGNTLLRTTFSNYEPPRFNYNHHQSYPDSYPTNNLPRTGAVANDSLGFGLDATYHLSRVLPHNGGPIQMSFFASDLQLYPGFKDEYYGIDNVVITALDSLEEKGSFYLPEEPITPFFGEPARGTWNLEIWDSRLGAVATNAYLVSWKLEIAFPQSNAPVILLTNGSTFTTNIVGDRVIYFAVDVPCGSGYATNTLRCITPGTDGIDLVFNQYVLPTNGFFDVLLLDDVTFATGSTNSVLTIGSLPLVSATRYYLTVSNQNPTEANDFRIDVNFKCAPPPLMNREIRCETIAAGEFQIFDYVVATNAIGFTIETIGADGNVDLYVRPQIDPFPAPGGYLRNSVNAGTTSEVISFDVNATIQPGLWRIGVTNMENAQPVNYCVRVTEVYDTDVSSLTLGNAQTGTVFTVDYYQVNLTTANFCSVEFSTLFHTPAANLSIYIAHGRVPSQSDYDLFAPSDGANPPLGPALTTPPGYLVGDWYIAIYNTNSLPVDYTVYVVESAATCLPAAPAIKTSAASYSSAGFKLEWDASPSEQYRVEFTDKLSPTQWQTLPDIISSGTGHFEFLDTGAQTNGVGGQRFYRLQRVQ